MKKTTLFLLLLSPFFTACVNKHGVSAKYYSDCKEYYDIQGYYHKECGEDDIFTYKEANKEIKSGISNLVDTIIDTPPKPQKNVW